MGALRTSIMVELVMVIRDANADLETLQRKAFKESWGTYNRARMVATLQETLLALNSLQTHLQPIHAQLVSQHKPDYIEPQLARIQETSQFLERNLLFEKSLIGRSEDETDHNETFAALQEKVQQVTSNVQLALQKTNLSQQLQNEKNRKAEGGETVSAMLQQKDRELSSLKEKLHQFEIMNAPSSDSVIKAEVVEKKVFETAKKIEWHLQSLKQSERNQQQALAAWEKNTQEKMALLGAIDEAVPKFLSESMLAIAGLRNEIEQVKQGMRLQQDEWQRLHEKNITEITRLHEERANDQKEWETKNRNERKQLLGEIQQKNEMIAYFQKKLHDGEGAQSRLVEEIERLKQKAHQVKENHSTVKKKIPKMKRKLRAPKIHSKK